MGTSGLITYRFRGIYHGHYNHWDSYPDVLGKRLVRSVPKDPEDYRAWLNKLKTKYGNIQDEMELEHWTISPADAQTISPIDDQVDQDECGPFPIDDIVGLPTIWPPEDNQFEWVYIFDLDNEVFSVQNTHHFKLSDIPKDWKAPFKSSWEIKQEKKTNEDNNGGNDEDENSDEDEGYDRHRWPIASYEPTDDHPATVSLERPQSPHQVAVNKFNKLRRCIVNAKSFAHLPSGKKSAICFAERLHSRQTQCFRESLAFLLVQWNSDDEMFRDICFATLCLFADPHVTLSLQHHSHMSWTSKGPAIIHHSHSTSELITDLFSPFHLPGESRRFCPSGSVFWMHGVLVHLRNRLDKDSNVQAGIVELVERAAEESVESCHGIVVSVTHVVLVRIFADGRVEHTRSMELFSTYSILDTNATAAIAHIFEAAQREKLSLKYPPSVLPPEVLLQILDEVTNRPTWLNCLKVSRFFRDTCQKKYLVKDHASISDDGKTCTLVTPADHGGKPVEYSYIPIRPPAPGRCPYIDAESARSTAASQIAVMGYDGQQRIMFREAPMVFKRETEDPEIDLPSSSPWDGSNNTLDQSEFHE